MSELIPHSPHPVGPHGSGVGGSGGGVSEAAEETIDLRQVFSVLRRHAILVVVITAACVVATAFVVLRQVPQYRAAAVIRLQDERGAMTGGLGSGFDGMMVARSIDPVMSQIQVLRSRAVSTEVVERTGLRVVSRTPEFSAGRLEDVAIAESFTTDTLELVFGDGAVQVRGQRGQTSGSYGSPILLSGIQLMVSERPVVDVAELVVLTRAKGVERFLESLSATIREGTDVIDVAFTGSDPRWAQEIVNTAVEVFQTQSALAARQQAQRRREFLQEQLIQSDSALILAQVALTDFQQREGVASSQDKLLAQQVGLLGLDVRREELAADRQVLNSLLDALSDGERATARLGSLISTPEVAANPVVSGLFSQLVRLEASRDSLTQGDWGSAETHPDVQRLNLMIGGIRDRLVESVTNHTQTLDARVAALDDLKARNLAELQSLPASGAEEVRLVQQVEAVGKIADQLREEYQRARISEAVETGQVEIIDPAVVPSEPIGSGRALKLVLGLMLGLMLGGGAAFVREHLNTSIGRREELEGVLQVPGLAVIPQFSSPAAAHGRMQPLLGRLGLGREAANGNGSHGPANGSSPVGGGSELVTISDLRAAGSEAYRTLRTNLIFSQAIQSIRTLVVTSSAPAEGKTTTAANLAVTFAQQGLKVLIVDCDLRKARLHNVFNVSREPGLTHVVLGYNEIADVIRPTSVDGLSVLPAGTLPPNPSELLGGPRMREVMEQLKAGFDLVIVDTPPLLAAADASVLGRFSDGVLLVVRAGHTDRGAAQQALQQLRTVGARVLGAVLNDPDAKMARQGGYYYNYYG